MRHILLTIFLLAVFVFPFCKEKSKVIWYDVEAEVTRYLPELKGIVKVETKGEYLEPWAIYKGICDAVFEIHFEEEVLSPTNRVGMQLPLKIEGNNWIIDFEHTRNGWTVKILGEGEITADTISGKWKSYGGSEEEKPVLRDEGTFTAYKR